MKKKILASFNLLLISVFCILPLLAQTESKVAILTVSGSGKTQEEAKQNALRSAVEQAFGAFISSNTQILNDGVIKDEIVSVSNGNIQEYTVISEIQTPDGNWSEIIKTKVSIDKLTSFCESKGIAIEFKGALFAFNLKQQELNMQNEEKAVENMCEVLKNISENCFDYEIKAGEPTTTTRTDGKTGQSENIVEIPITIYAIPNNNLKIISDYFGSTLKSLSLNESEIANYSKINKETYSFEFEPGDSQVLPAIKPNENKKSKKPASSGAISSDNLLLKIYLRSDKSCAFIADFMHYFNESLLNFEIVTDIDRKMGNDFIKVNYTAGGWSGFDCSLRIEDLGFKPNFVKLNEGNHVYDDQISLFDLRNYYKKVTERIDPHDYRFRGFLIKDYRISFKDLPIGKKVIEMKFTDTRTTDEISKMSGYKIIYCKNKLQKQEDPDKYGNYFKVVKE